jgi:iron complex outermembrane receptor protein
MHCGVLFFDPVCLLGSWTAGPAFAQSVPTASAPSGSDTHNPQESGHAQDIVITARKRSESAQRVPITITALDGSALTKQNIKDLFQAVTVVPGAIFSRAPDDGLALTFRGLGTAARSQAFEQSIALFTDGVFLGKTRLYSVGLFDIDRIEFIKGTQSTLLGKNASLGAISIITRQPGERPSFEGRAGYELVDGGYQLDAASDLPLNDAVAMRVAAHYNDLDGWVHNDITGHDGPEHKDLGLRATIRANLGDRLRVTGSYQYSDNRQVGASYQLVGGDLPAIYGDNKLDGHTSQFTSKTPSGDTDHRTRSNIASLRGELDIGTNKLVSQTAYVAYKLHNIDDFDFSPDDSNNFDRREKYRQFTQEIRLESPVGGPVDYMAGLFFLSSHWNSLEDQDWAVPGFPPAGPPGPGQLFNGPFVNHFVQDQKAYSAFASVIWHIAPALRLSGGMRYTRETKGIVFGREAFAPFTVWNTIANPPFDPTPLSHKSSFLDGNATIEYDLGPNAMAYVSFGHGSKSGGYVETNTIAVPPQLLVEGKVPPGLVAAGAAIKDESVNDYEVGIKSYLLERRVKLNLAAFDMEIENFQDTVFTGGTLGFITFNGPARSRGFEVESAAQLGPHLQLDGGLTYADATGVIQPIDPATNAPEVDANGDPVLRRYRRSQAPRLIFNLDANYRARLTGSLDWRAGGDLRHRSMMFNQRQEEFPSTALTTLDLWAGIEARNDRWGVDIVAKNVTNSISEDFASPSVDPRFAAFYGAYLAGPNPLRTIMLSIHTQY